MIIADFNKIAGRTYPSRGARKSCGRDVADSGAIFLHGQRDVGAERRSGAVAQSTARGGLLHPRGDRRNVPGRGTAYSNGGPMRVHPVGRLASTGEHRRHAVADDLLLRSCGRRGALAAGIGGDAAARGSGSAAVVSRRQSAVHGEAERVTAFLTAAAQKRLWRRRSRREFSHECSGMEHELLPPQRRRAGRVITVRRRFCKTPLQHAVGFRTVFILATARSGSPSKPALSASRNSARASLSEVAVGFSQ